ncbi:MAG TPA: UDP-N-acetylglucosamine 2-epimerase (non-hydrolyzing) [Ktedonobacterales bacterium]|jgi:UDP-N-acetylglucosamine 2-epimerase
MRFVSIVGARPQFIKLAPVSRALRLRHDELIIHTGQHYDAGLSSQFFEELTIPTPDYHLGIGSASHGAQTGRMLEGIEEVLLKERPDGVIVFGDTNSTLAGALAAAKLHIPVAHVEAGLRSFNREMPEEINRVLTDHASTWLFCPTETARQHLLHEGIAEGVAVVGDVMYDVLRQVQPKLVGRAHSILSALGIEPQSYLLLTIHRPANTDDPARLGQIAQAISGLGRPVIFPVHPRTRRFMKEYHLTWSDQVRLIEPVGHLDMLALVQAAYHVATDSGGLQKEAFLLGAPCVTLRDETEWPETLEGGWNRLVGSHREAIIEAINRPQPEPLHRQPFGEGDAALRIAGLLHN